MKYHFTKMHGLGNDFVVLDFRKQQFELRPEFIRRLSDRRFGIGCDQFIVIEPPHSSKSDVFMRIFNADGGEVKACGNGTRCLGSWLASRDGKQTHIIQTGAGYLKTGTLEDGRVHVDMGLPSMEWQDIPLSVACNTIFLPIHVPGFDAPAAVSMGNPHLIFFVRSVDEVDLQRFGAELTHHSLFTEGTNVEVVEVLARDRIRMRVWERGAGITMACATGACASVVAGVTRGLLEPRVIVHLDGGDLEIYYDTNVIMYGPVQQTFEGTFDSSFLALS